MIPDACERLHWIWLIKPTLAKRKCSMRWLKEICVFDCYYSCTIEFVNSSIAYTDISLVPVEIVGLEFISPYSNKLASREGAVWPRRTHDRCDISPCGQLTAGHLTAGHMTAVTIDRRTDDRCDISPLRHLIAELFDRFLSKFNTRRF